MSNSIPTFFEYENIMLARYHQRLRKAENNFVTRISGEQSSRIIKWIKENEFFIQKLESKNEI